MRALILGLGSLLLFVIFLAGGEWADSYHLRYGVFNPSPGELALKLHTVAFILPASLLLARAIGEIPSFSRALSGAFDALREGFGQLWPAVAAFVVVILSGLVRVWVLNDSPVTDDENVYAFQAKLLVTGRLYTESLPVTVRAFFDNQFIVNNGRWFGMYFPGHPAVLAAAARVGLEGWVGPIEAAITLLIAVGIARRVFGERVAILTGALLILSPFLILLSATQLSQPTSSLALAFLVYTALRIEGAPRTPWWWGLAAIAASVAFLVRPQAAVVLVAPALVRLAWLLARGRLHPGRTGPFIFISVAAAGASIFLWVNWTLTGHLLETSYHAYWAGAKLVVWRNTPYYPFRELGQSLLNLNFWLFGWPLSLVFVPFFVRSGPAWTLAAMPLAAVLAQAVSGVSTVTVVGPVYFGECIPPLVVLSAAGIERAVTWARAQTRADGALANAVLAWPLAMTVFCLIAFLPVQISSLRHMSTIVRAPYALVERQGLDRAIVFVHSLPALHWAPGAWVYYSRNNSPDLSDPVLFVKDLGPEQNKKLIRYFPDRTPYMMGMRGNDLVLLPVAQ